MVDALVSGTSVRKDVQVRVLSWAQEAPVRVSSDGGFFPCPHRVRPVASAPYIISLNLMVITN